MRNSKKGFTIVELVIVIAVIAILAAVLIPTFSSVTNSARESAAQQEAKAGLDSVIALTNGTLPDGTLFAVTNNNDHTVAYNFVYSGNKLQSVAKDDVKIEHYATTTGTDAKTIYAVYVSASCWLKANGGSIDETLANNVTSDEGKTSATNRANVEKLLVSALKQDTTTNSAFASAADLSVKIDQTKSGTDYFAATVKDGDTALPGIELRVYYTTDIQPTQVIFIGHD